MLILLANKLVDCIVPDSPPRMRTDQLSQPWPKWRKKDQRNIYFKTWFKFYNFHVFFGLIKVMQIYYQGLLRNKGMHLEEVERTLWCCWGQPFFDWTLLWTAADITNSAGILRDPVSHPIGGFEGRVAMKTLLFYLFLMLSLPPSDAQKLYCSCFHKRNKFISRMMKTKSGYLDWKTKN